MLPSFSENMPVVIMEALALGRPVISTYVAGIPELVEPGKTGWLPLAGDEFALSGDCAGRVEATVDQLETESAALRLFVVIDRHDSDKEAGRLKRHFEGQAVCRRLANSTAV